MKMTSLVVAMATMFAFSANAQQGAAAEAVPPGTQLPAQKKATAAEKEQAKSARKTAGGEVARQSTPGEGNPVPAASSKMTRAEKDAARAPRKAETRRANNAGELTSKGEAGSGGTK